MSEWLELAKAAVAGLAFSIPVLAYMRQNTKDRNGRLERFEGNLNGLRADVDGLVEQLRASSIADAQKQITRDNFREVFDAHLYRTEREREGWRASHDPDRRR